MTDRETFFNPLPIATQRDRRLTASHWRVMSAIAGYDRLGRGGGYYRKQDAIAADAAVDPTNVSRLTADLVRWGYLAASRHPLNRRLRVYRLKYNGKTPMLGEIAEDDPEDPIMLGESAEDDAILGMEKCEVFETKDETPLSILCIQGVSLLEGKEEQTDAFLDDLPNPESIAEKRAVIHFTEQFNNSSAEVQEALNLYVNTFGGRAVTRAIREECDCPGTGFLLIRRAATEYRNRQENAGEA